MSAEPSKRGAAPVGLVGELDAIEAATVVYLRLWNDSIEGQDQVRWDFAAMLGTDQGHRAARALEELCNLCTQHGRRPLLRHAVQCSCVGADESCFANFVAVAAEGEREDAMLIATLLVRPDVAPLVTALAMDVGLALKRMRLCAPRAAAQAAEPVARRLH